MCWQTNIGGSKCSRLARYGTAAVAICGAYNAGVTCTAVAHAAGLIANNCLWFGHVGGWVTFGGSPGVWVIVYHS